MSLLYLKKSCSICNLPSHDTVTLLLVIEEITLIDSPIAIDELTLPMHFIVLKVAFIATAAGPHIDSISFHLVAAEGSLVARLIKHSKFTMSMPESVLILSLEHAIMPRLTSLAMLLVIQPAAFVDCSIGSDQFTLAGTLIIDPIADIVAAVGIYHAPVSIVLIARPVAVIARAIFPHLRAMTVSARPTPLAEVRCALICQLHLIPAHHRLVKLCEHLLTLLIAILILSQVLKDHGHSALIIQGISLPALHSQKFEPHVGVVGWGGEHEGIGVNLATAVVSHCNEHSDQGLNLDDQIKLSFVVVLCFDHIYVSKNAQLLLLSLLLRARGCTCGSHFSSIDLAIYIYFN